MGSVAKSYMRKGVLIYEKMRKFLTVYEEGVSHLWLCNRSLLNFLIYKNNWFHFLSVQCCQLFRRTFQSGGKFGRWVKRSTHSNITFMAFLLYQLKFCMYEICRIVIAEGAKELADLRFANNKKICVPTFVHFSTVFDCT